MVQDRLAVAGEPRPAAEQRARAVGGAARLARRQPVGGAAGAVAAARQERHDHPLSDREVRHRGADPLDDARRLVAEQHRHRADPVAVDDRQVGVAQAGGLDADQELGVTRRVEVEVGDRQRRDSA